MADSLESILEAEFVNEYKHKMQFFYASLFELPTNIFILEKALSFPFRLFAGPDQIFFRQVVVNFYDVSILTITWVAADQDEDLFTLPRFKNAVIRHIQNAHREPLQEWLRAVRFDEATRELLARAKAMFLFLLAGYGYRPGRSLTAYLVFIFGFAIAYFALGYLPLFPDALVFSITSFHGRGFFTGLGNESSLHEPLVVLAACEAVVGLLIEISFIATFTQRFFGK